MNETVELFYTITDLIEERNTHQNNLNWNEARYGNNLNNEEIEYLETEIETLTQQISIVWDDIKKLTGEQG